MYSFTVPVIFCVLSIAISQTSANDACTKPFQQHQTRTDLCYTRLPRRKCNWIDGSVYLKGNCFVPSGFNGIPSRKFFCDFNEYFQHCENVPGQCCMQSTKYECDKYTRVEYDATLGTCFAPVSEINLRTAKNVKCPKRFKYDDSFRQCAADLKPAKRGLTQRQCKKSGGYVNATKCITEVIQKPQKLSDCANVTNPDCLPPPFTTTTLLPTTTVETTEPTEESEPTTVTELTTSIPKEHTTTSDPTDATNMTSTTSQQPTVNADKTTHTPTIGDIRANAACQVPFQQHPTRPDLCYTRLPKRKCDWIPVSRFVQGNCFVPSGRNVVPSRKFFCDFNEHFQHCKKTPGYCCMQSIKFECDKYTVVKHNATLGTCFGPVAEISIRTADNVVCPAPFKYDDSFRQCAVDLKNITDTLTPEQCKALGGIISGDHCLVDPLPPPPPPPDNCTDVTLPECQPPPFTTTLLAPPTFKTTEPVTDAPELTTATEPGIPKPTEGTITSETAITDERTYDLTKTSVSNNVTTTTAMLQTTETTDFTGSNAVTELTTSKPTEFTITPDPNSVTTTKNGSSLDDLTTATPQPSISEPNVVCTNLFKYNETLRQCVADVNNTKPALTEAECKAAGGHINGTNCITEIISPADPQPICTDITDPACLPPPFETTTLAPSTTVETAEPETTTAKDFTTSKPTELTKFPEPTDATKSSSSSAGVSSETTQPPTAGTDKTTHYVTATTDSNKVSSTTTNNVANSTFVTDSLLQSTEHTNKPDPSGTTRNGSFSGGLTIPTSLPQTAATVETTYDARTTNHDDVTNTSVGPTITITGYGNMTVATPGTYETLNSTNDSITTTLTPQLTEATKKGTSSDGPLTATSQPPTFGPDGTTYDPLKTTDATIATETVTPSTTKTTGVTVEETVTTSTVTSSTGMTINRSSEVSPMATTQPPTAGTDKTTYGFKQTTDSSIATITTASLSTTETTHVTGSETVTTIPPETTTLYSTSNGTPATLIPYSTGATSFTTRNTRTSNNPTTLNTSTPSSLTPNFTPSHFNFNVVHNCPIGFMITEHFCIGVYTPDCETKHNGYKYEEACFIRFNDTGSNVGKRMLACDNLEAVVTLNNGKVTKLSTSTTLATTTMTKPIPATTTTTTTTRTTTTKKRDPWPYCADKAANCRQQKSLCNFPPLKNSMITNCARTCNYCHVKSVPRPPPPPPPLAPQCKDIGSNCEKRLCNITKGYHDLYFKNCKRTCGYC